MTRTALTLTLFAGLAAWASAQDRSPKVHRQLRMLDANRVLLDQFIEHGLSLSDAKKGGHALDRADECRLAAATLAAALREAAGQTNPDPERVAELSDHVAAVVRGGLVPNLDEARDTFPVGSEGHERLKNLSARARKDLTDLDAAFPADGALAASPRVAEARKRLSETGGAIVVP